MTDADKPRPASSSNEAQVPPPARQRVIDADCLFEGEQEVLIQNGDDTYRLRRTRHGKLILHK